MIVKDLSINVNLRRFGYGWVKKTMAIKDHLVKFRSVKKSLLSVRKKLVNLKKMLDREFARLTYHT